MKTMPVTTQNSGGSHQPTDPHVDLTDTLSADEVSVRLGIHRDEVYREAAAGELPSLLIGRRRRFPRAWLQAYLRELATAQGFKLNERDEPVGVV